MKKRFMFLITMEVEEYATEQNVKSYLHDAAKGWKGGLRPPGSYGEDDPGDPMWESKVIDIKNAARALNKGTKAPYVEK